MPDLIEKFAKKYEGQWDFDPKIQHHFSDELYAKQVFIPKGHFVIGHKHAYSHLSILASGKVKVETDIEEPIIYEGSVCIDIKAGVNHAIIALEDSIWYCIHHTTEKNPEKIDRDTRLKE